MDDALDNTTSDTSILNSNNAEAVILQAFEVFSGRAFDNRLTTFPYLQKVRVQPDEVSSNDFFDVFVRKTPECTNDGVVGESSSDAQDALLVNSFYTNCLVNGDQLNGRVVLSDWAYGFQREFSDSFSVEFQPGGIMEVSGSYRYQPSVSWQRRFELNNFNYHLAYPGGTLTVNDANLTRSFRLDGYTGLTELDDNELTSHMTGSFSMSPPVLNGASVAISTLVDFTNTELTSQLFYASGQLQITAEDSQILLNADNGDATTVDVTTTNANGNVTIETLDWSKWHSALAFHPAALDPIATISTEPTPLPDGDGSVINENTYTAIVQTVFDIYTGDKIGPSVLSMPGYTMPEFPNDLWQHNGFGDPVFETCANGGEATLIPYKWGARQITTGWNSIYNNCLANNVLYEGEFKTRNYGNFSYYSRGINITDTSSKRAFAGNLSYKYVANRDGGPPRHYSLTGAYSSNKPDDEIEVNDINLNMAALYNHFVQISGHFSFKSTATGQQRISVTTADPLVNNTFPWQGDSYSNNYPKSGVMVVDAGNGNSLWLNASTGNDETFTLTIYQPGEQAIVHIESWVDWQDYFAFNFDLHKR